MIVLPVVVGSLLGLLAYKLWSIHKQEKEWEAAKERNRQALKDLKIHNLNKQTRTISEQTQED